MYVYLLYYIVGSIWGPWTNVLDCCTYLNYIVDEEDDRESGVHVSDMEVMELGVEGNTPVDGQIPKGLSGMASSGRRGRTFSTGKKDILHISIVLQVFQN